VWAVGVGVAICWAMDTSQLLGLARVFFVLRSAYSAQS
jgi:hypothetical protein